MNKMQSHQDDTTKSSKEWSKSNLIELSKLFQENDTSILHLYRYFIYTATSALKCGSSNIHDLLRFVNLRKMHMVCGAPNEKYILSKLPYCLFVMDSN